MTAERKRIRVRGVVQGVGFRPFIYRTAVACRLGGSVRNLGDAGVEIFIEGDRASIEGFMDRLRADAPPLSRIESIETDDVEAEGEAGFSILASTERGGGGGSLPPDVATCDACVAEILGDSRFTGYWATSCVDCGPRFTVIESLPYDRPRTSMVEFPMCVDCSGEYIYPLERRYHAQTTACAACGPRLRFDGSEDDAIARAARALCEGRIVAIKGIGGTHIACDATSDAAVDELRRRLGRSGQPFAVMATEPMLDRFAIVDDGERIELRAPARPIVVLKTLSDVLASGVAPGLHTVGAMLPYTGLHHLLFRTVDRPLVMTSANRPGHPMLIENEAIQAGLDGIVDGFLLHDRRIVARCDDSVRRRVAGKGVFLRRSRGFVPEPISAALGETPILALGPETDVAFAIYADGAVTMSQHIGSVGVIETLAYLREAIEHLYRITHAPSAATIACDLHPSFATTRLARELADAVGARVVPVQHHVAHLCSLTAENGLDQCVGIVLDGYGYGWDGAAWGGEILVARDGEIARPASLREVRLPGGDLAARRPLRMAAAFLYAAGASRAEVEPALIARGMPAAEAELLSAQIERGVNAPWTTSAGRFLDAVAAWFGVCAERTYEGEPAMRLEATAAAGTVHPIDVPTLRDEASDGERRVLDTAALFLELTRLANDHPPADVAATAQAALAAGIAGLAVDIASEMRIGTIGFSGGVAYNDAIASSIRRIVESGGLRYVTNERVPCGDGGVSFGQAAFAGCGFSIRSSNPAA